MLRSCSETLWSPESPVLPAKPTDFWWILTHSPPGTKCSPWCWQTRKQEGALFNTGLLPHSCLLFCPALSPGDSRTLILLTLTAEVSSPQAALPASHVSLREPLACRQIGAEQPRADGTSGAPRTVREVEAEQPAPLVGTVLRQGPRTAQREIVSSPAQFKNKGTCTAVLPAQWLLIQAGKVWRPE